MRIQADLNIAIASVASKAIIQHGQTRTLRYRDCLRFIHPRYEHPWAFGVLDRRDGKVPAFQRILGPHRHDHFNRLVASLGSSNPKNIFRSPIGLLAVDEACASFNTLRDTGSSKPFVAKREDKAGSSFFVRFEAKFCEDIAARILALY